MRGITIIMAVIVFGLSCLPCADREAFAHSISGKKQATSQLATSQDHRGPIDICGPFCSCSCCSVSQVQIKQNVFEIVVQTPSPTYSNAFLTGSIAAIALPIWQPPQLQA